MPRQKHQIIQVYVSRHTNAYQTVHMRKAYSLGQQRLVGQLYGHTIAANKTPTAHALTVAEINAIVNNMLTTTSFHPCIHFFSFLTISTHMTTSTILGLNKPADTPRHNSPSPPQHFCPPNSGDASFFAVQV